MPKLPIRLSEIAPTSGGKVPKLSTAAAAAPAIAVAQGAQQIGRQVFSLAEQQKRLQQWEEILGASNSITKDINALRIQSQNNPDFKGHTKRMTEGLEQILESRLKQTDDREVDIAVRRTMQPTINRMLVNADAFQTKKQNDSVNALKEEFLDMKKREAVLLSGKPLEIHMGILDAATDASVALGSITRVQGVREKKKNRDDVMQGKAFNIIRNNPEEFLRQEEKGLFPFANPKTRGRMIKQANERIEVLLNERERNAARAERAAERQVREDRAFNDVALTRRLFDNLLNDSELDDSAFRRDSTPGRLIALMTALKVERDQGGRGNPDFFRLVKLQLQMREDVSENIIIASKMNNKEKEELIEFRNKLIKNDEKLGTPLISRERQNLIRNMQTGSKWDFNLQDNTIRSSAISEYDRRVDEGKEDPIAIRIDVQNRFSPSLSQTLFSTPNTLAKKLIPAFKTEEEIDAAVDIPLDVREIMKKILRGEIPTEEQVVPTKIPKTRLR